MKRLKGLLLVLIALSLSSCHEEQYINEMIYNIKNNTDSVLHIASKSHYYRETTIYPGHTAFIHSNYSIGDPNFWFSQGLADLQYVTIRLNDVEGDTLAHWEKNEDFKWEVPWLTDHKYWSVKRIDDLSNSTEFTLPLNNEDLGL